MDITAWISSYFYIKLDKLGIAVAKLVDTQFAPINTVLNYF